MISSAYTHPLEIIFGNMVSIFSGLMILKSKMHIVTLGCWSVLRVVESLEAHSGFDFPWSMFKVLPFSAGTPAHNYHHLKNNGNYGTFTIIWDSLFGTNTSYMEHLKEKEKNE